MSKCDRQATLPLHGTADPRMYMVLTAKIPGCVAFSLPVQRRSLQGQEISASFRPLLSQREPRG
jgi:hypothetical protein